MDDETYPNTDLCIRFCGGCMDIIKTLEDMSVDLEDDEELCYHNSCAPESAVPALSLSLKDF